MLAQLLRCSNSFPSHLYLHAACFDSPPYSRDHVCRLCSGRVRALLAARSRAAALGDRLTLGVAGQGEMYHLPVLLAEQLGFFKAEGLDVVLRDFLPVLWPRRRCRMAR